MNRFKKALTYVLAVATLECYISVIPVSADFVNIQNDDSIVSKVDFGTTYEKNTTTIIDVEFNQDSTVLYFYDGTTYTLPMCDDIIESSLIEKLDTPIEFEVDGVKYTTDECYYLIGYAISYMHHNYMGNDSSTYVFPDEVTLPDGTVLSCESFSDVQAVYNLDGKYMGYRTRIGEGEYSNIILSELVIGDSEDPITEFTVGDSVYPRGDINLDGKANTADLLYLKKYLLGLIEW